MQLAEVYKSYEELPATLAAKDVKNALGISRAHAYNLMNSSSFPVLRLGKRLLVTKSDFLRWVNANVRHA